MQKITVKRCFSCLLFAVYKCLQILRPISQNWITGTEKKEETKIYMDPSLAKYDMPCLSKQCRSGSALFVIKYVNFYQTPGSSNLIGWKLSGHGILIYSAWQGLIITVFTNQQILLMGQKILAKKKKKNLTKLSLCLILTFILWCDIHINYTLLVIGISW